MMLYKRSAFTGGLRGLRSGLWLLLLFMSAAQAAPLTTQAINGIWELARVDGLTSLKQVPQEGFPVYWITFSGRQFSMLKPGTQDEVAFGTVDLETGRLLVKGLISDFVWTLRLDKEGQLVADEYGGAYSTFKKLSADPTFRPDPARRYAPASAADSTAASKSKGKNFLEDISSAAKK